MDPEQLPTKRFAFGDFELDAGRRVLLNNGEAVALNYKTLELLLALISRKGEILSKDELLEAVWDGQFVEEGNLTVHISALRKALGETKNENRYIVTVPGRGYSFVAEVNNSEDNDIVIESRSMSQIYVEEEISDEDEDQASEVRGLGPKPSIFDRLRQHWILVSMPVLILLILAGISGYFVLYKKLVPFQRMNIKRLTSKGTVSRAAISPDGKLFAYVLPDGDKEGLWVGHVDGGEAVEIRPPASEVYLSIKFAPDGGSIYYAVSENYSAGTLYKTPVLGGTPQKIRDNIRTIAFSPDGKQFVFFQSNGPNNGLSVFSANVDGGNEHQIASLPKEIGTEWHSPAWSPDGETVAFSISKDPDDNDVFVINIKDGVLKRLTARSWRTLESVTWMHDGSGLVAAGIEKGGDLRQLWFIPFPSGDVRRISNDLSDWGFVTTMSVDNSLLVIQGVSQSNVWVAPANNLSDAKQITFGSPGRKDGWNAVVWTHDSRIVYTANTNDGSTILMMNADGSKPRQLVPNGGANNYPSLTSDGRTLVFASNRSGHFAVWRADMNGGNMSQVTGDQIAGQPQISPDGKWILYNSKTDSPGELWRIPATGGEPFRMTVNPADWAFVSPDSKSVACELWIDGKAKLAIISIDDGLVIKTFEIPRLANLRLGVHWTPDGRAVAYRDWSNGIWRQNLDGGEPQRLDGLPEEKLLGYGWSPDGRYFAFTRGTTTRDVVLITDGK